MDGEDQKVRSLGCLDDLGLRIHTNREVAGIRHRQVHDVAGAVEIRDDQVAALGLEHGPSDVYRPSVVRYRRDLVPSSVLSLACRLFLGGGLSVRDAAFAFRGRCHRAVCRDVEREVTVSSKGVDEDFVFSRGQRIA